MNVTDGDLRKSMTSQRRRIERQLARFIAEELLEEPYDKGDPLDAGAVDSLGIEQLVEHIEQRYDVHILDEEMIRENFESIAALAALVESKLPAGEA
jgi:acyl carrier protein